MLLPGSEQGTKHTYGELIAQVETAPSTVETVLFSPNSQGIEATVAGEKWKVSYPSSEAQIEFQNLLEAQGVEFDSKGTGGSGWDVLISFLPFLLIFGSSSS